VSAVVADDDVMLCVKPGQHGSTFGGNPLAARIARTALEVIVDEGLAENARRMGGVLRTGLRALRHPMIEQVRGLGLLNAIVLKEEARTTGWDLCLRLMQNGLLAKPTHGNVIRLAPPLVIDGAQIREAIQIVAKTFASFS
jgi:ornithine--oxo-acid transaminase